MDRERYNSTFPPSASGSMAAVNRVRIIGGRWRGRPIRFPERPALRPTPDRVRETLFNWLGQTLEGKRTWDAYTGSGALSLEALSRGAALAVATDRDAPLIRALKATAAELGATALEARIGEAVAELAADRRSFDVIFLDPPFDTDPWLRLLPAAQARLAPGGSIYAESARPVAPPDGLSVWREAKAGQVHYALLRRASDVDA
jgi:16S rRNA (guanine966-N2)-methyltransferase